MSSIGAAGHSRSLNLPLSHEGSPESGDLDGSPSSDPAANASSRAASVKPTTASNKSAKTSVKPAISAAKPVWRARDGSTTIAVPARGLLSMQGGASRLVDRSRSSAPPNQPPVSLPGQTQSSLPNKPSVIDQPRIPPPIAAALASSPRASSNPQAPVISATKSTVRLLVVNKNNNVNHAPGGSIVNNNYNETNLFTHDPSSDTLPIIEKGLGKHHVPGALHDAQPSNAGCMQGTRVQLLYHAKRLLATRGGPHIVWIVGMAGTGKTSIALTLCRELTKEATVILGGTFFCSRSPDLEERTDAQRIVPTLSTVLARRIPTYADALAAELKDDPDLAHKSIGLQSQHLLFKPLEVSKSLDRQIVFVVDALDECSKEEKLIELIDALAGFTGAAPVKFLFTSRPEMHIRETSISDTSISSIVQLNTIDPELIAADIRLYIQKTFEATPASSGWYNEDDLDELASLSGGLFIFASTAVAYILKRKDVCGRTERLSTVKLQSSTSEIATAPLDKMYTLVLMRASNPKTFEPTELDETRRIVAAILSTRTSLTLKDIAELLGMSNEHLRGALEELHAVISVPEDDGGKLRTLHTSFGDFIFTRAPEHIRIRKEFGHYELARGCLQRMTAADLCFNVSRSVTSYKANPKTKPNWIAGSLTYACLHWAHHVHLASMGSSFDEQILFVLRHKLLFWLELLSIIGEVWRASGLLYIATSVVAAEDVLRFLRDAHSFVTSSHEAIERSAPHIYLSALPFAPQTSLVRQNFSSCFIGLPSIVTFGIDHHDGRCVMVLAGHNGRVTSIAYSPDGKVIASGSDDATVRLWDTRSGVEIRRLPTGSDEQITSIAFTPDSLWLVADTSSGSILQWNTSTGRLLPSPLRRHTAAVQAVTLSPDGKTIASCSKNGVIGLCSINTGMPMSELFGERNSSVYSLASGSSGKAVVVWDPRTNHHIRSYSGHQCSVKSVAIAPDGRTLASASEDRTVRIWNLRDDANLASPLVLRGHSHYVNAVCFSHGGLNLASCSNDRTVRIWDVSESYASSLPLNGHTNWVNVVAISDDGCLIASTSKDGSTRVWDAQSCEQMYPPLIGHEGIVHVVRFSSDGRRIATGSADTTARLWDSQTGQLIEPVLRGHTSDVYAVAFSPDNLHLASGSNDYEVRVWDTNVRQTGLGRTSRLGFKHLARAIVYSPDGTLIVTNDVRGAIRTFNALNGQLIRSLNLSTNSRSNMRSLAISTDGTQIIAPAGKKVVGFNPRTGARRSYTPGHTDRVNTVAYSPDGGLIASGGNDRTVRLLDVNTNQAREAILYGHASAIRSVAFSADGRFLVTGSYDTTIRLWDLEKSQVLATQCKQNALATLAFAQYKSGWLVSPARRLLLWVPPEYRGRLEIGGHSRIIATSRIEVTADDGVLYQGEQWTKCWRTENSTSS